MWGWRLGKGQGRRLRQGKCWVLTGTYVLESCNKNVVKSPRWIQMLKTKKRSKSDIKQICNSPLFTSALKHWYAKSGLCRSFSSLCPTKARAAAEWRQPMAIWPGSSKSQMKRRAGSCKSHVTKGPVKAQEHCSAMRSSLRLCLQSFCRQEAVIPISCLPPLGEGATTATTEVWRKVTFFMAGYILPPKDVRIYCDCAHDFFFSLFSELMKRDYNGTGITFVWMWTLAVTEVLSWKHWWWVCGVRVGLVES